jgi:magnesium chelatase subunit D
VADTMQWLDTWNDAMTSLQLLQIDPSGFGGIVVRAPYGPVRTQWLKQLSAMGLSITKLPSHLDRERLLGGIDLSATLQHGQLRWQAGLLAQADGGVVCIPMAERFPDALTAPLVQTLDAGCLPDADNRRTAFGVVALDESDDDEATLNPALRERLGLWIDLHDIAPADIVGQAWEPVAPLDLRLSEAACVVMRQALLRVSVSDGQLTALCAAALGLGITSLRVPTLALRVACAHAVLNGRVAVADEDMAFAARRVLAPRALQGPETTTHAETQPNEAPDADTGSNADEHDNTLHDSGDEDPSPLVPEESSEDLTETATPLEPKPEEILVAAALASLPNDVLDRLLSRSTRSPANRTGRSGQLKTGAQRGRPLPPRPGSVGGHARLHVLATLRAAAPKQRLRSKPPSGGVSIRSEDFHLRRYQQSSASCVLLALDASGSAALQRLAEAKGAVELLLQQSYARRDSVCIVSFKGAKAELLLPMTRSLVRAKRAMTGLPGGGGTPLASGLKLAYEQAMRLQRQGITPLLVILSDGRANVTLDGLGGRTQALADAQSWCDQWRASGHQSLWIDTSVQPDPQVQTLAYAMGGRYMPMPQAHAHRMAAAMDHLRQQNRNHV